MNFGKKKQLFKAPSLKERLEAFQPAKYLSNREYLSAFQVLENHFESHFEELKETEEGDWLADFKEHAQSVQSYKKRSEYRNHHNKGDNRFEKNKIYLVPIGSGFEKSGLSLETLRSFCEIYLQMPIVLHDNIQLVEVENSNNFKALITAPNKKQHEKRLKGRLNEYKQLLTADLHSLLLSIKGSLLDARFVVGITLMDLYPDKKWNFVFGQAMPADGTGIFSFARYGHHKEKLLKRSLQTLVHEILHLCGIAHCVYFSCCINGSNSLEESDLQPLHLCPIDLLKLHLYVGGFDLVQREQQILSFYSTHPGCGFEVEREWSARLIKLLSKQTDS